MLPKPRRPASIDRPSMDARSSSGTGHSSSSDPDRGTLAVNRLSKDSSVSKIPANRAGWHMGVAQLREINEELQATLRDPRELMARAEEERRRERRREALDSRLRQERLRGADLRAQLEALRQRQQEEAARAKALDADIADVIEKIQAALARQELTVESRAREVDYAMCVADSKRTLAELVTEMPVGKESELATWQNRTLDSCVEYQQELIHLATHLPPQAAVAVDKKELMVAESASAVAGAVENDQRQGRARPQAHHAQRTAAQLVPIAAEAWAGEERSLAERLDALHQSEYNKIKIEIEFWEAQDEAWRKRLAEMQEYIVTLEQQLAREMVMRRQRCANLAREPVQQLHQAFAISSNRRAG